MKKTLPFLFLSLSACSSTKSIPVNNDKILQAHSKPVTIFGIGNYRQNSIILTLVDAQNQYFTLEAPKTGNFKVGNVYP